MANAKFTADEPFPPSDLVTAAEMAAIDNVGIHAIYNRIRRFTGMNALKLYETIEGSKCFSLAQWRTAVATLSTKTDKTKAAMRLGVADPSIEPPSSGMPASTQTAQTIRKLKAEADLKELAYAQKRSLVIDAGQVRDAAERCAEVLVRELDRLPTAADALAVAYSGGGLAELRRALAKEGRRIRGIIATAMLSLAEAPGRPEIDPGEDEEAREGEPLDDEVDE